MNEVLEKERELVRGVQLRTAYRVYVCLLESRAASVKDIQKAMGFHSSAQARFHLNKLVELDLAHEDANATFRVKDRRFGILRFFVRVRNSLYPMSLFYSVFFAFVTLFLFLRTPTVEILLLGALITSKEIADTYMFYTML